MISFVIPCYYSMETITGVVDEVINTVENKYRYEVILVNDGSTDKTFEVIKNLCNKNNHIKGINLSKNFGQHSAIMAGFSYVEGDVVVTVDDDGQIAIDEVIKLITPILEDDYDIAVAKYKEKKQSKFKNFGSYVNDCMAKLLLSKPKGLYFSSFMAIKRYVVDEITKYENPYPYLEGLFLRTTLKIINIETNHKERSIGRTTYTFKKLLSLWMNGFTAFSVKPLRIGSVFGILLAMMGVIYSIYIVIHKIENPSIQLGWSSLMAVQLIIGGAILGVLGLIGEYIGRIYICLNKSPQYVVREYISNKED